MSALLIAEREAWCLVAAGQPQKELAPADASPADVAAALVSALPNGAVVGVLLNSDRVFQAKFPLAEVGGQKDATVIAYHLEAELPFSAEELIVDTVVDRSGQVSAFAVDRSMCNEFLQTLSVSAGNRIQIGFVAPKSLLIAQALSPQIGNEANLLLAQPEKQCIELLQLRDGFPVEWRVLDEATNLHEWTLALGSCSPTADTILIHDAENPAPDLPLDCEALRIDSTQVAQEFGLSVLTNRGPQAWINFLRDSNIAGRSDELQQQSRNFALIASLCLLAVAGSLFFRAWQLNQSSQRARHLQGEVFASIFPDQRKPSAVLKRLRSEFSRLRGSRSSDTAFVKPLQAMPILSSIVQQLPRDVEASVTELRIEGGQIYLDMEVQQHEDASRIVEALNARELEFAPPSTEATNTTIVALLRGRPRATR